MRVRRMKINMKSNDFNYLEYYKLSCWLLEVSPQHFDFAINLGRNWDSLSINCEETNLNLSASLEGSGRQAPKFEFAFHMGMWTYFIVR